MTKTKSTKRALLTSALALLVCVSMLIGSTYAWFTDTVTTGVNTIQSGKLNIDIQKENGDSLEGKTLDFVANDGRAQDEILWEPGCTYNTEEFYIVNNGDLNLKFKVAVSGAVGDTKLLDVIDFTAMADASQLNFNTGAVSVGVSGTFDLLTGYEVDTLFYGVQTFTEYVLKPGQKVGPVVISGHMDEKAGNDYQGLAVEGISITLSATQATGEEDSYTATYDENATYAGTGAGKLTSGSSAVEISVNTDDVNKIGSVVVPATAVAEDNNLISVNIEDTVYAGNITVDTGYETKSYDISVYGLKENNDVPVKVQLLIPEGLDPDTVKLYHYDTEIECTYNPMTGYITFESATFSPFTVVYDAGSEYVPPVVDEDSKLPVANVVRSTEYENVDLAWGNYGVWAPTAGLDSKLEAAYTFSCAESVAEAAKSDYANWYCDFYVKLDKDLAKNEIFLGGNYGSFGWVGFHNGDLTLEANTEIPLLGSVTSNPWTYLDVANNVGTFICGVGDVNNALSGATFTVTLRLTNPENDKDYKDISTISYKFE